MEETQNSRTKRMGVVAFLVIAAALVLYFLLFRYDVVADGIASLLNVLSPILFGFVIAYILNTPMCLIENGFLKIYVKRKRKPGVRALKVIRTVSVLTSVFGLVVICYMMVALLLPELIHSIQNILFNIPMYSENIQKWYADFVQKNALDESSREVLNTGLATAQKWVSEQFMPQFNSMLGRVTSGVWGAIILFKNLILGLIVSIYVMLSKDSIIARFRRAMYALFNAATANLILKNVRFVDEKFGGFLIGKIIDSAIIGVLCYVGMAIFDMPYKVLVAVVVGFTNIIPFFGPIIGAVPSAILIGCVDPLLAVYFVIFIFVLQQLDGSILGPRILGNSVGVSSFMVLVAILIGGGLFGFAGMIVGVPLCAILVSICQSLILQRIVRKNLPGDIDAYLHMESFDPEKRMIVKSKPSEKIVSLYRRIQERSEDIRDFCIPLKDNPWDRTAEDVERDRINYEREWNEDQKYCEKQSIEKSSKDEQAHESAEVQEISASEVEEVRASDAHESAEIQEISASDVHENELVEVQEIDATDIGSPESGEVQEIVATDMSEEEPS